MTFAKASFLASLTFCAFTLATEIQAADCFEAVALTRSFGLGLPVSAEPTPDGKTVLFLRSGPRDTVQRLYAYDVASGKTRELIAPEALIGQKDEHLTPEEKARRERARISVRGFTFFSLTEDGKQLLLSQSGKLFVFDMATSKVSALPGEGWTGPEWSPNGQKIAAIKDHDIYILDIAQKSQTRLTSGGSELLQHGEAEFVAQEEMGRREGFWWSPDSQFVAYEEADNSAVEPHYIANPRDPAEKPVAFRYPRAGTANAKVRLGVIPVRGGKTQWIGWDQNAFPYLLRVTWAKRAPLALVVENRPQTEVHYLAANVASGTTKNLLTETNAAWVVPDTPRWRKDGSGFTWMTERNGQRQLELHDANGSIVSTLTPTTFRFDSLLDIDDTSGTAAVLGGTDPLSVDIYRVSLKGGEPAPIAAAQGIHGSNFGDQHGLFAHSYSLASGERGVEILDRDGKKIGALPSVAEKNPFLPHPEYFHVGSHDFDALVLKPRDFDPKKSYPVILSVYGGPAAKTVWNTPSRYFTEQCMADRGYIVAIADNRGTPGRDSAWFRAIKNNAIDIPLADQVEALQGLAQKVPQMDLKRVGVFGWSFGGYFSAMATMRRPDIFAAGIAGAPVVDWQDYDTHYTERYMGLPQENGEGYRVSNVLTYADQLRRPLLIIHGVTDDNVYFEHTMKMTEALLRAGKTYELLLMPGTHMVSDNALRARQTEREMNFFAEHLGGPK